MNFDDYDDDRIASSGESIFGYMAEAASPGELLEYPKEPPDYESIKDSVFASRFFDSISSCLLNTNENKEKEKLQKQLKKLVKENEALFPLLKSFDCKFIYKGDSIELYCGRFNLSGSISVSSGNKITYDKNFLKILQGIAKVIKSSDNLNNILNKYEKEGFYPSGTPKELEINGKKVLAGTLKNKEGKQILIDIKTGAEITVH